jgi:hypothetical protein
MATKYISPTGNDSTGDGTIGLPYLTIAKAYAMTTTNDTISCAAGTYTWAAVTWAGRTFQGIAGTLEPTVIFNGAGAHFSTTLQNNNTFNDIVFTNVIHNGSTQVPIFYQNTSGTLTFNRCVFRQITTWTSYGSALFILYSTGAPPALVLNNCLLHSCKAINGTTSYSGQALFSGYGNSINSTITITNCVFYLNFLSTQSSEAIIFLAQSQDTKGIYVFKNTIIQSHPTYKFAYMQAAAQSWQSLTSTYCCNYNCNPTYVPTGTGNITTDPLFIDPTNSNFNLRPTSPCIGTGIIP